VSEDLGVVVQAIENGSVKIWDTQSGDSQILKVSDRSVDLVALSPDGHSLITGEGGMMGPGNHRRTLRWWDLRAGTNSALATDAQKVLFSPDGRTLAAFRGAGSVQFWDAATRLPRANIAIDIPSSGTSAGLPEFRFPPHAAFSSDGRLLATSGSDDTIRLWEVATGKLRGVCTGHKQAVTSVAFSPDGKTLASASDDSTLKFWNVATQQELLTVRRLGGTLRSLLFSPDGRVLVGASGFSSASGGLRFFHAPAFAETDLAAEEVTPKQTSR
jgi:WD40 repeat protein